MKWLVETEPGKVFGPFNRQVVISLFRDGSVPPSEGSFFQTENNYQALVYYKGTGERTWQLVGYRAIALR